MIGSRSNLKPLDVDLVDGRIKRFVIGLLRRRAFIYIAGITAIIGALVIGGVSFTGPDVAEAASTGTFHAAVATSDAQSPRDVANAIPGMKASDAVSFLAFDRWHGSNSLPSPNVGVLNIGAMIGGGITMIGSFLLAIASTLMWIIGILLSMAINLDLLSRLSVTIDHAFAIATNSLLGGTVVFGLLVAALIGTTIWQFVKGDGRRALLGFGVGVLSIFVLFAMSSQSNKNHPDTPGGSKYPIAGLASAPKPGASGGIITASQDNVQNPNNWAPFSPGFLIAQVHVILNGATGVVSQAINTVTTSIGTSSVNATNGSICGNYVNAMYEAFDSSGAVSGNGNMQILKSYDSLVRTVYFDPYVTAAYGDSAGARNAWCRIAESQAKTPAGEQAYLSQKAGAYLELTRWGGPQSVVKSDGSWFNNESSARAGDFFGTNVYGKSAASKMVNYFAACTWPKGGVAQVNPEWSGVLSANFKIDATTFLPWNLFEAVGDAATGKSGPISNDMCLAVVDGSPGNAQFGFSRSDKAAEQFAFQEKNDAVIFTPLGTTGSYAANFAPAIAQGNTGGYNFYLTTQGNSSFFAVLYGLIALILLAMMTKYILPLILGAVVAQVIATLMLMFLPISILLLTIPLRWSRKLIGVTIMSVLAAYLVNFLFLTVTTVTLMIVHMLMFVFSPVTAVPGTIILVGGGSANLIGVLQVGLAIFLALKVVRMLLGKVFAIDMSSMTKAALSAGALASTAMLGAAGYRAPKLFNGLPDAGAGPNAMLAEARSRIGNGIGKVQRGADTLDGMMTKGDTPSTDDPTKATSDALAGAKTKASDVNAVTGDSAKTALDGATVAGVGALAGAGAGMLANPSNPTAKPGEGINSVVNPENERNHTPEQQQAANERITGMADGVLGNKMDQTALDAILQPGERGDLAALGTTPERIKQIADNDEVPSLAGDRGASPIRNADSAIENLMASQAEGARTAASEQFSDMSLADQMIARSALNPGPVGIDERGNLLPNMEGQASGSVQPSGDDMVKDGHSINPMIPNRRGSDSSGPADPINPARDIPMIFDQSYMPEEREGTWDSNGHWNAGPVKSLYNDFGDEPETTFEWNDQKYDLDEVSRAMPGLTQAQQPVEPIDWNVYRQPDERVTPDRERVLRRIADMGRGKSFEDNIVRWFR